MIFFKLCCPEAFQILKTVRYYKKDSGKAGADMTVIYYGVRKGSATTKTLRSSTDKKKLEAMGYIVFDSPEKANEYIRTMDKKKNPS